jgi:hypothetical protein
MRVLRLRRLSAVACLAFQVVLLSEAALAHDGSKYEPADGKILHGAGQHQQSFDAYTAALGDPSIAPFVTKEYMAIWDRWPMLWLDQTITWSQLQNVYFQPFRDWMDAQQGLMPEVSLEFSRYSGVFGDQLIPTGILDPVIVELAHIIRDFDAPCFVRPGFEPGSTKYSPGTPYISSYRRIVDIFRAEGVDNAAYIWCAGPTGGINLATEGLWFPGDAYVDWIGVDVFTPQSFEPSSGSGLPWADSLWTMLHLADCWKKPVMLSETSAVIAGGLTDPSPAAAQAYWDQWFGPVFDLIRTEPRIKAFNYIDWDWPSEGFPAWVDARIENNPTLVSMIADELSDPRYLHRDSPDKFGRPWLMHLGVDEDEGGTVTVEIENADVGPGSFARFGFSTQKLSIPGTPGYLDNELGVFLSGLDQPWFLGPAFLSPFVPVAADGTAKIVFTIPTGFGLANTTYYLQGGVSSSAGVISLTQPFELEIGL